MIWKTANSQGKVDEKSGKFEMAIEWQPCKSSTCSGKFLVIP